jgi:LCP family protein required for cell wall assembly
VRPRGPKALERFRRKPEPGAPKVRPERKITPWRVVRWVLLAILAWILLSIVIFFISAQVHGDISDRTEEALSPGGSLATGSTVLVIGSDARPADTKEPEPEGGFGERADTIMLMHVGVGSVRRLSILRDTYVPELDGKINSAFAGGGGAARLIEVLEDYLGNGLEINHVMEIDFENFPDFIDSLGGVDVTVKQRCVKPAERFGGYSIRELKFRRGEHHLDGRRALGFARIRKNACNPREDDRHRSARQQEVMSGIRDAAISPSTFVRLPWVAWNAPKTVKSDMEGPGLSMLFADLMTGGSGKTQILRPDSLDGPGGSVIVEEGTRKREIERLLGED